MTSSRDTEALTSSGSLATGRVAHDPRRVFLSGPPGAGKSSVGRAVAARLRCAFVDLDEVVAERAGKSIPAIFVEDGEPAFRALEREEALRLSVAAAPVVIALGGGTVVDRGTRLALLEHGTLVGLDAEPSILAARAARERTRPLLAGDIAGRLSALLEARRAAYQERAAVVRTDHGDLEAVAEVVVRVVEQDPVVVPLGERTYVVRIGSGLHDDLVETARSLDPSSVLVVTDENVRGRSDEVLRTLARAGHRHIQVVLPAGEASKHLGSVQRIWDAALDGGIDRSCLVLAIGGGVVGDLGGFAAATLLRGLRLVQVPTTMLAMVDASVGGKTGFDHARGKNLLGAFHQPHAVVADLESLASLSDRHLRAGLAEAVKMALVLGDEALAELERDAPGLVARDPEALGRTVRAAVRGKAAVVARDERETRGLREVLNVGHTIGHALEAAAGFSDALLHGEAVALGMVAELCAGGAPAERSPLARRVARLLRALGLPVDVGRRMDGSALRFLGADKKREGATLRFPRVRAPGHVALERVAAADLWATIRENLSASETLR